MQWSEILQVLARLRDLDLDLGYYKSTEMSPFLNKFSGKFMSKRSLMRFRRLPDCSDTSLSTPMAISSLYSSSSCGVVNLNQANPYCNRYTEASSHPRRTTFHECLLDSTK